MGIKPPILSENVGEMAFRALLAAKKWGTLIGPGMKSLNIGSNVLSGGYLRQELLQ